MIAQFWDIQTFFKIQLYDTVIIIIKFQEMFAFLIILMSVDNVY